MIGEIAGYEVHQSKSKKGPISHPYGQHFRYMI